MDRMIGKKEANNNLVFFIQRSLLCRPQCNDVMNRLSEILGCKISIYAYGIEAEEKLKILGRSHDILR